MPDTDYTLQKYERLILKRLYHTAPGFPLFVIKFTPHCNCGSAFSKRIFTIPLPIVKI